MEVTVISLVASGIKRSTTANYVSKIRMIARFINVLSQEQQEMLGVKAIPKALIDIDVNAIISPNFSALERTWVCQGFLGSVFLLCLNLLP